MGAYPSLLPDNTPIWDLIHHLAMPQPPQSQSPRLLDQVRESIRLKHFSLKTEQSYVYYIRDFILFHNKRHPSDMATNEIRAYLTHLAVERKVAAST
jgi:hypothetical protein